MYIYVQIYILMSTEKKGVKQLTTHTLYSTQCYTAAFQHIAQIYVYLYVQQKHTWPKVVNMFCCCGLLSLLYNEFYQPIVYI